ncbi:MAG: hypothetical protein U5L09_09845 [Bacteroidales bacterium]|nr:hypothetical protein [Bacteroidales bacterium]
MSLHCIWENVSANTQKKSLTVNQLTMNNELKQSHSYLLKSFSGLEYVTCIEVTEKAYHLKNDNSETRWEDKKEFHAQNKIHEDLGIRNTGKNEK